METNERKSIWSKLRQSHAFFFTLIVVFLVWLVSNMSEKRTYREQFQVRFEGYDTLAYVAVQADTTMTLDIESNGFYALRRSLEPRRPLKFNIAKLMKKKKGEPIQISVNLDEQSVIIAEQLDMRGVSSLHVIERQLGLQLMRRHRKAFLPDISDVTFQFEGMQGLCGNPRISPDTIWLYGSDASLDKINQLRAEPQTIEHITHSGNHKIRLKPVWKQFPDLRVSSPTVNVYLPVEMFVERTVSVPLSINASDSLHRINLYPTEVSVKYMVPMTEYNDYTADDFQVTVNVTNEDEIYLKPEVSRFPSQVRVKSISPSEVQYIVIK